MKMISFIPECIPFDVRVILFQSVIAKEKHGNAAAVKTLIRVRRSALFEDGYYAFTKIPSLKGVVAVRFINDFGIEEEGEDAGGLFKEFLVELSALVFNPNYGLFKMTDQEKELYPNHSSREMFGPEHTSYY